MLQPMPVSQANHQQDLSSRVFVALDVPDKASALDLVEKLSPLGVSFKVGMQLFYAEGIALVSDIQRRMEQSSSASQLFVDLKLHDIPNTVAKAAEALVEQNIRFFNVHALGGLDMMRAASESVQKTAARLNIEKPTLIAVTVLTSFDEMRLSSELQVNQNLTGYVQHLAKLTQKAGLDGVVCSAQEASVIQDVCGKDFLKVTPGIRMPEDALNDQSRILTPQAAFDAGATHLVIGRPITQANDPVAAAERLLQSLS